MGVWKDDIMAQDLVQHGWASDFITVIYIDELFTSDPIPCPGNPNPNTQGQNNGTTNPQTSWSPEDKWGPAGYDGPDMSATEAKRLFQVMKSSPIESRCGTSLRLRYPRRMP